MNYYKKSYSYQTKKISIKKSIQLKNEFSIKCNKLKTTIDIDFCNNVDYTYIINNSINRLDIFNKRIFYELILWYYHESYNIDYKIEY